MPAWVSSLAMDLRDRPEDEAFRKEVRFLR